MSFVRHYRSPIFRRALLNLRSKHTLSSPNLTHCTSNPKPIERKWSQAETDIINSIQLPPEAKNKLGRKSETRDALRARMATELLPGRTYLAIFLKICLDRRKNKEREKAEKSKEPSTGASDNFDSKQPFQDGASRPNRHSFWSCEEKRLFIEAMDYFGTDWELVSKHVGTRTRKQCQTNYHLHSKDPDYYRPDHESNRAKWKREEVNQLIDLIERHGESWDLIKATFPTRSLTSIKKKYFALTREKANKFSPDDDKRLSQLLVEVKLPNWGTVSKLLNDKFTPKECQVRWSQIRSSYK
ncbi:hypothetical protein DSO57_1015903 [Entomophthora muscae]|uniref:Uncharacterized protein n=1 Tax=Entomophthora muscae TaxID=34485 RepID=A0ACC2RWF0_9FUNG|nr:hypothetical protein DSO57_1015903 [Entomophthora muscae]